MILILQIVGAVLVFCLVCLAVARWVFDDDSDL